MRLVVTPIARSDIDATLRDTGRMFGPRQLEIYAGYIDRAFEMLTEDPYRPSSVARDAVKAGARSLRLAIAAGRSRAASHVIYYRIDRAASGDAVVIVLRLLHERMEPTRDALKG